MARMHLIYEGKEYQEIIIEPDPPERRLKIFFISDFQNFVQADLDFFLQDLPENTRIIGIHRDVQRMATVMGLYNPKWDLVDVGEIPPRYKDTTGPFVIDIEVRYDDPKELENHAKHDEFLE